MAAPSSSLAKLTSLSTQTLSLLLERQRLQTLPSYSPTPPTSGSSSPTPTSSLHIKQISKNLASLRSGILDFEKSASDTALDGEATVLLREQYERMRNMLGEVDGAHIQSLEPKKPPTPPPPSPPLVYPPRSSDSEWKPYSDDPNADVEAQNGNFDPHETMQMQRQLMDDQDNHLTHLSHSISRQHTLSLQIGDELDVHSGLLDGLDSDLDRTDTRLSSARKKLDRVRRGLEGNVSSVAIGVLILLLLILIVIFKT